MTERREALRFFEEQKDWMQATVAEGIEKNRRPAPDLAVEYCQAHGIEPKLHCLNYDPWTPMWMPDDVPTIKEKLDRRFAEIAQRYSRTIPSMEAIIYWNVVDGYAAFAPQGDMTAGENFYHAALLRFDLSPKPAYYALKKLIHEDWHTELAAVSGEELSFWGFCGEYEVTVEKDGKRVQKRVGVHKNTENAFEIII